MSITSHIFAFITSLLLLLVAYFIVVQHAFTGWTLISVVVIMGVVQALVQILFFLGIGFEAKPKLNLIVFLFMCMVIIIINGGSMWIMRNLDYNLMMR